MASKKIKVFDFANYVIELANKSLYNDKAFLFDGITHLKLQKILYFVQAVFLIKNSKPAFEEKILAWKYGPVVEEIYTKYKDKGKNFLEVSNDWNENSLTPEDKSLVERTWEIFGGYSASKLVEMTHDIGPRKETPQSQEISLKSIKNFYEGRIFI